jgi:hypothetical protein
MLVLSSCYLPESLTCFDLRSRSVVLPDMLMKGIHLNAGFTLRFADGTSMVNSML